MIRARADLLTREFEALFHRFVEIVKSHPLAIGAAVLAVVLLAVWAGRSTPAPAPSSGAPAVDTSAAGANAQLAAVQAQSSAALSAHAMDTQVAQAGIDAQLQAAKDTNATQLALATVSNQTAYHVADLQTQVALHNADVTKDVSLAGIGGQVQATQVAVGGNVAINQAQMDALKAQSADALNAHLSDNMSATMKDSAVLGTIGADYQTYLGRAPDAAGLAYWSEQVNTGKISLGNLASAFAASPEHNAYDTALHAIQTDPAHGAQVAGATSATNSYVPGVSLDLPGTATITPLPQLLTV